MCDRSVEAALIDSKEILNSLEDNLQPINNTTKAKLNLHVKRRLQYDYEDCRKNPRINHTAILTKTNSINNLNKTEGNCAKTKSSKRVYNKRVEKNNIPSVVNAIELLQGRKSKQKFKQLLTNTDEVVDVLPPGIGENRRSQATNRLTNAGDDDSGGQEADIRCIKEQYKCQDVLSMVLSVKKRTLLQDPQVHVVLSQIMKVINS